MVSDCFGPFALIRSFLLKIRNVYPRLRHSPRAQRRSAFRDFRICTLSKRPPYESKKSVDFPCSEPTFRLGHFSQGRGVSHRLHRGHMHRSHRLWPDRSCTRSFLTEPMHWGRLFNGGDGAHIDSPPLAMGPNSAAYNVPYRYQGLCSFDDTRSSDGIERNSGRLRENSVSVGRSNALNRAKHVPGVAQSRPACLRHRGKGQPFQGPGRP